MSVTKSIEKDKFHSQTKKFHHFSFAVFKPEELRQALMPTLEKIYRQDPESGPFRQPVDPNSLGIPDYFEIVRKPMDISTIQYKLSSGQYSDPWEYVEDVWLMFDNAWLYNRKTSRVYRYCTRVSCLSPLFKLLYNATQRKLYHFHHHSIST